MGLVFIKITKIQENIKNRAKSLKELAILTIFLAMVRVLPYYAQKGVEKARFFKHFSANYDVLDRKYFLLMK